MTHSPRPPTMSPGRVLSCLTRSLAIESMKSMGHTLTMEYFDLYFRSLSRSSGPISPPCLIKLFHAHCTLFSYSLSLGTCNISSKFSWGTASSVTGTCSLHSDTMKRKSSFTCVLSTIHASNLRLQDWTIVDTVLPCNTEGVTTWAASSRRGNLSNSTK